MRINPIEIINAFYRPGSEIHAMFLSHAAAVTQKALGIARRVSFLKPDCRFIEEAAMLHDIGIFLTYAPFIGCMGVYPYACHGYLGGQLLEARGLAPHARVCERHVGVGLSADDIQKANLPLPAQDALPVTVEERIICYADKFFSKKSGEEAKEEPVEAVVKNLEAYGSDKVQRFYEWMAIFN
jgi:uncharacterized protein